MRGYDAFAGVIKSGGKTRRAAKMVILNADHPDIEEFITCKADEEKKAWALIDAGYDGAFNVKGGAYDSVFFQNANHSVRVTDEFMQAVVEDKRRGSTRSVLTGAACDTYHGPRPHEADGGGGLAVRRPGHAVRHHDQRLAHLPEHGAHQRQQPVQRVHVPRRHRLQPVVAEPDEVPASADGEFDTEAYKAACRTDDHRAGDPGRQRQLPDARPSSSNSHDFRPLGLGYANLGVLLMDRGLPYDSDGGRAYAAAVTALMHGEAYAQSARIASAMGPFAGYAKNAEPMLRVIDKHRQRAPTTSTPRWCRKELLRAVLAVWDEAYALGVQHGYRNSQVTVLAPTGTIGFMMDCDTTGIEPDIALVKYKKLVGGGVMKIVNQSVPGVLKRLGYSGGQVEDIVKYIDAREMIEGAPHLKDEHLADLRLRVPAQGRQAVDPLHGPHQDDGGGAAVPLRRHLQDRQHAVATPRRTRSRTRTSSPGGWA